MGAYSFKKRFVKFIVSGEKQHTIRAIRVHPDKPGNTLYLYTGLRTQKAKLLLKAPCVKIEQIIIDITFEMEGPDKGKMKPQVWISSDFDAPLQSWISDRSLHPGDTVRLSLDEREALARRDGFQNFAEMMKFWREPKDRLPFRGHIIYWRKPKNIAQALVDAEEWGMPTGAFVAASTQLKQEWASTECPVCHSEKWANSPFCRSCSIRCQRANLFHYGPWPMFTKHRIEVIIVRGYFWAWMRWYDMCRDYLFNVKADT